MNWFKKHGSTLFLVLALFFGLGLLIYPSFADYWNSFTQSRAIVSYAETVASMNTELYERIWQDALAYNEAMSETGMKWIPTEEDVEEYNRQLNINNTGNMGYIDIPKINVSLPLYHGTTESVLQTSIGHITGTSLPAGGLGSHCVLSGHRGLPSARLFSDLDRLIEGDKFILTILDQTLTYEVDQIRIVEPSDLSELYIDPEMDYCTLVTCTPYGINTHRLLVRGHRVENDKVVEIRIIADALVIDPVFVAPVIALPVLLLLIIWVFLFTGQRRRRKKAASKKKNAKKKRKDGRGKTPPKDKKQNRETPSAGKKRKDSGKKPASGTAKKAVKPAAGKRVSEGKAKQAESDEPAVLPRRDSQRPISRTGEYAPAPRKLTPRI